jgi:phospholipid transport system transporter-binding protein
MAASIREGRPGELLLEGVLDHACGSALRARGHELIAGSQASTLLIDCSAVQRSTSVGLSLLLCFLRDAKAAGKSLRVRALSDELRQLAGVSGLSEILELD